MYLNKVLLYGRLGRDPDLRVLPNGTPVSTFSLATSKIYKDKEGNKQEKTEWHNIVLFGRQAELVNQYLKKGDSVFIEGRLQTRSWETPDGQKRYRTEIIAETMQFGPRSYTSTNNNQAAELEETDKIVADESAEPSPVDLEYPEDDDINPDDIPF